MSTTKPKYKLSKDGEALVTAAKNDKLPHKGIVSRKGRKINLAEASPDDLEFLKETQYVTENTTS